jgi:heme/copper-type cytochrome/quinol oxidase subunit 2
LNTSSRKTTELVVPAGKPVSSITSVDILHSLFIPAFRIRKTRCGMQTHLWFMPDAPGEYSFLSVLW